MTELLNCVIEYETPKVVTVHNVSIGQYQDVECFLQLRVGLCRTAEAGAAAGGDSLRGTVPAVVRPGLPGVQRGRVQHHHQGGRQAARADLDWSAGEGLLGVAAGQGGPGQAAVRAGVGRGGLRGAARRERGLLRNN